MDEGSWEKIAQWENATCSEIYFTKARGLGSFQNKKKFRHKLKDIRGKLGRQLIIFVAVDR